MSRYFGKLGETLGLTRKRNPFSNPASSYANNSSSVQLNFVGDKSPIRIQQELYKKAVRMYNNAHKIIRSKESTPEEKNAEQEKLIRLDAELRDNPPLNSTMAKYWQKLNTNLVKSTNAAMPLNTRNRAESDPKPLVGGRRSKSRKNRSNRKTMRRNRHNRKTRRNHRNRKTRSNRRN